MIKFFMILAVFFYLKIKEIFTQFVPMVAGFIWKTVIKDFVLIFTIFLSALTATGYLILGIWFRIHAGSCIIWVEHIAKNNNPLPPYYLGQAAGTGVIAFFAVIIVFCVISAFIEYGSKITGFFKDNWAMATAIVGKGITDARD